MEQSEDSSRSSSLQSLFYLFCPPYQSCASGSGSGGGEAGCLLGTYSVGIHFLVPFIDRVAKKVNLKEQVEDFPPQPVITKDNVTMQIDTVVYFQITDPKLYAYGVENPIMAIENLTATTLRNIIGDLELDETLTSRRRSTPR